MSGGFTWLSNSLDAIRLDSTRPDLVIGKYADEHILGRGARHGRGELLDREPRLDVVHPRRAEEWFVKLCLSMRACACIFEEMGV